MRATWIIEAERKAQERHDHLTNWHRWFAWRPVWVAPLDCRWLETVERKCEYISGADGGIVLLDFRPLPSPPDLDRKD